MAGPRYALKRWLVPKALYSVATSASVASATAVRSLPDAPGKTKSSNPSKRIAASASNPDNHPEASEPEFQWTMRRIDHTIDSATATVGSQWGAGLAARLKP